MVRGFVVAACLAPTVAAQHWRRRSVGSRHKTRADIRSYKTAECDISQRSYGVLVESGACYDLSKNNIRAGFFEVQRATCLDNGDLQVDRFGNNTGMNPQSTSCVDKNDIPFVVKSTQIFKKGECTAAPAYEEDGDTVRAHWLTHECQFGEAPIAEELPPAANVTVQDDCKKACECSCWAQWRHPSRAADGSCGCLKTTKTRTLTGKCCGTSAQLTDELAATACIADGACIYDSSVGTCCHGSFTRYGGQNDPPAIKCCVQPVEV